MQETREQKLESARKSVVREWIESIIIAFIMAMIVRTFVIQAFKIPSGSMRTTLMEGDLILVNKFIYGAKFPFTDFRLSKVREPKRGDIIVFIYPVDPKKNFVKRLVAKEGETVEIRNGTIYINDLPLLEPVFSKIYYYNRGNFAKEGRKITVPKDSYFALGDNSANSEDSRSWGFIPKKNLLGKAILIYWPPQRIRMTR